MLDVGKKVMLRMTQITEHILRFGSVAEAAEALQLAPARLMLILGGKQDAQGSINVDVLNDLAIDNDSLDLRFAKVSLGYAA